VASGDFRIEPSRPQRLEAHLGSCVGVSIVDRHAKVGGLAHFLLPDGGSTGFGYGKAVCARTGLPLFLDALREAGCLPAVMEATVAGGALVGSISRLDLELDLGGRTVDVVNAQLKDAGIAVVASETGGHFGSRLLLDLDTLASTVEPMVDDEPPDPVRPAPLTPDELTRATERIRPIPQTALKIIRLLQTDDYGLKDIAAEIRRDQVLTARIIRACNAAYLGAREEITSIEHALLVLGGRAVGTVTLAMLMETVYNVSTWGYSMSRGGLYHHAVSTAIVSEQLAMITRAATRDLAYTAGLLHDIGKVLLDQSVAAARPLFYREVLVECRTRRPGRGSRNGGTCRRSSRKSSRTTRTRRQPAARRRWPHWCISRTCSSRASTRATISSASEAITCPARSGCSA
jgi:chemotaxis receptor (MCP) glutamine deamidase CheD